MHRGMKAPDALELEWMGENHPDTLAKLRAIEAMAFEQSGRIDELRREVGVEAAAPSTTDRGAHDKIVAKLKSEAGVATAPAPATADVSTKKKS